MRMACHMQATTLICVFQSGDIIGISELVNIVANETHGLKVGEKT